MEVDTNSLVCVEKRTRDMRFIQVVYLMQLKRSVRRDK